MSAWEFLKQTGYFLREGEREKGNNWLLDQKGQQEWTWQFTGSI